MDKILIIFSMFAVTFGIRFLFLAFANRLDLPLWLKESSSFIPTSVLAAIIAPSMFLNSEKEIHISADNSFLLAGLVAIGLSYWKKNLLLTISCSMVAFLSLRFL